MTELSTLNPREVPFIYGDTWSYQMAKYLYEAIPPSKLDEELPTFWIYTSPEKFLEKFGHFGQVVWARRISYHALYLSGQPVLRFWTHGVTARVYLNLALFNTLQLPEVTPFRGHDYFVGAITLTTQEQVDALIKTVRTIYVL